VSKVIVLNNAVEDYRLTTFTIDHELESLFRFDLDYQKTRRFAGKTYRLATSYYDDEDFCYHCYKAGTINCGTNVFL
jgi:hypothetical protein